MIMIIDRRTIAIVREELDKLPEFNQHFTQFWHWPRPFIGCWMLLMVLYPLYMLQTMSTDQDKAYKIITYFKFVEEYLLFHIPAYADIVKEILTYRHGVEIDIYRHVIAMYYLLMITGLGLSFVYVILTFIFFPKIISLHADYFFITHKVYWKTKGISAGRHGFNFFIMYLVCFLLLIVLLYYWGGGIVGGSGSMRLPIWWHLPTISSCFVGFFGLNTFPLMLLFFGIFRLFKTNKSVSIYSENNIQLLTQRVQQRLAFSNQSNSESESK